MPKSVTLFTVPKCCNREHQHLFIGHEHVPIARSPFLTIKTSKWFLVVINHRHDKDTPTLKRKAVVRSVSTILSRSMVELHLRRLWNLTPSTRNGQDAAAPHGVQLTDRYYMYHLAL